MTLADPHDPVGSEWRRWDPHIHSLGTTFEDRFGGEGSWDDYIDRVNAASPAIEALGVTDYFRLDGYKHVLERQKEGKLPAIKFIFPNIELRYSICSPKGSPINFHLLESPDDPNHIIADDMYERNESNTSYRFKIFIGRGFLQMS